MVESKSTLRTLGPALIVASVVLGPGSILTASQVGASFGYELVWVLVPLLWHRRRRGRATWPW